MAVLLAAVLAVTSLHVVGRSPTAAVAAAAPQTWVVDAVDDGRGNRWVARATGGSDLTIVAGDTVRWQAVVGTAGQGHDLTSTDDGTPWSPPVQETLAPGGGKETYSYTFDESGTYTYICATHETAPMVGTITVLSDAPPANQAPAASPMVSLSSDSAPTTGSFMAHASDPDGDDLAYAWDFGDAADTSDRSAAADPTYVYRDPGTYTAVLSVSDGQATTVEQLQIIVDPEAELPADDALAVTASATPVGGAGGVAFAAEVTGGDSYTTGGEMTSFADGRTAYPDLRGTATLARRPASTHTSIEVTGLQPNASHMVHVHEQACSASNGGAHFRFDTTRPFAESNEIWLPFTSDAAGRSGLQEEWSDLRAGADAVSVVIHDPDNSARRIGCVDLERDASTVAAVWSFGDGTTGTGVRRDHVYRAGGRYTANVTVTDGHGGRASDSVDVVVAAATAPSATVTATVTEEPGATVRPAGLGPVVRATSPVGGTGDRTPTVRARIVQRQAAVTRRGVILRVDGEPVRGTRYAARTGRVRWTPRRSMSLGLHVAKLVVVDAAGHRTVKRWRFRVR